MTRFLISFLLLVFYSIGNAANFDAFVATVGGVPAENVAVVLEPVTTAKLKRAANVTIAQVDRELNPFVTIVQTGTAIDFPNRDPIKHHLYSFSPAKPFEIKLYAGQPSTPIVFDKPGAVALGCNIHDWMEAYVLVVDSPYFAKSDSKGQARIVNIPPGNYRLKVWHPRQKTEVAVRDISLSTAPLHLDLLIDLAPRIVKAIPPLDTSQY